MERATEISLRQMVKGLADVLLFDVGYRGLCWREKNEFSYEWGNFLKVSENKKRLGSHYEQERELLQQRAERAKKG